MRQFRILQVFIIIQILFFGCKQPEDDLIEPTQKVFQLSLSDHKVTSLLEQANRHAPSNGRLSSLEFREDSALVIENPSSSVYSIPLVSNREGTSDNLVLTSNGSEVEKSIIYSLKPDYDWLAENYEAENTDYSSFKGDMFISNLMTGETVTYSNKDNSNGRMDYPACFYVVTTPYNTYVYVDVSECTTQPDGGGDDYDGSTPGGDGNDDSGGDPGSSSSGGGSTSSSSSNGSSSSGEVPILLEPPYDAPCDEGFVRNYKGVCVPGCPFGYVLDGMGNCVADVPCAGDPLHSMEISDYNSGVNSNRFGCVRIGRTDCEGKQRHGGIDLKAPIGTSVYAIESGTVYHAGEHGEFGNWIIIQHGETFYAYAHLRDKPFYNAGDDINTNSLLGYVGETGNVPDGESHLHFEVKKQNETGQTYNNSEYINPENVLGTNFDNDGNETDNENCN